MRPVFFFVQLLAMCMGMAFGSASLPNAAFASGPSFDCSKANHDAEELICRDYELITLDNQLAVVYRAALENIPAYERKNLKAMQRGWVKGRNDCWKANELRSCVKFAYETRITELQIQGGLVTVPEPVEYQCEGGEHDYLTAIFYQETVMPAVVLTRVNYRDSSQVIAWPTPSGSGTKFQGRNVLFWNKGNEAMVEWNGDELKCREKTTGE